MPLSPSACRTHEHRFTHLDKQGVQPVRQSKICCSGSSLSARWLWCSQESSCRYDDMCSNLAPRACHVGTCVISHRRVWQDGRMHGLCVCRPLGMRQGGSHSTAGSQCIAALSAEGSRGFEVAAHRGTDVCRGRRCRRRLAPGSDAELGAVCLASSVQCVPGMHPARCPARVFHRGGARPEENMR